MGFSFSRDREESRLRRRIRRAAQMLMGVVVGRNAAGEAVPPPPSPEPSSPPKLEPRIICESKIVTFAGFLSDGSVGIVERDTRRGNVIVAEKPIRPTLGRSRDSEYIEVWRHRNRFCANRY